MKCGVKFTYTIISISGNTYNLGFTITGLTGQELLTVSPVENSIFDAAGNTTLTSQTTIVAYLSSDNTQLTVILMLMS